MAATLNQTAPTLKLDGASADTVAFEPFTLPSTNQRTLGAPHPANTAIPLALEPSTPNTTLDAAISTIESLQANNKTLTTLLATHGVLLFRNLPIHSASDFSRFAHAFGYKPHEIIGIVVDRPLLAPNVAPANEAPPHILIYNHNESPQVPHAPEYIFFNCHVAPGPGNGGETPISSSLELFHRAQRELPDLISALATKGILSRVTYKVAPQYSGGSTLRQAFGKHILDTDDQATRRAKIEAQLRRYGRGEYTTWTWENDAEETLTVTHRLPAIRTQQSTNLPTLFTGLAAYYKNKHANNTSATAAGRNKVTSQMFGDGTEIPEEWLGGLARITDEIRVLHTWEEGDVLVYDNVIAQHGRQPWKGEQGDRIVYASLWDGESVPGKYGEESWDGVVQAGVDVVV